MAAEVTAELDRAYGEERAKVLATLTRHLGGDLGLAEDAVQDVPRRHDQPGGRGGTR